jgi:hypothetical protein
VAASARITVSRQSKDDLGQREIYLHVDGEELGILRHGETVTRELPPGPHRLRAHNTLFRKTLEIDLHPGEEARFVVVNKPGFGTYSMMAVIGAGPVYLVFERLPNFPAR